MSFQLWFNSLKQFVDSGSGTIPWTSVSKTGSSIADLATRDHNLLTSMQGGTALEYYHLTSAEYGRLLTAAQYNNLTTLSTITTGTTLSSSYGYVLCNAASAAFDVTLPAASSRYRFHIKRINSGANAVTVKRAGSDTIEGATDYALAAQYNSVTLYSDGSGVWYIESST